MQLYHQTLLHPAQIQHALALNLLPIKPREQHEKPKQLLIARSSSLELYHYLQAKGGQGKYDLKCFFREEVFSNICAVEAVEYCDEDMKKDLIVLSLINGKYQLFEWLPHSSRLALRDQNYIFGSQGDVESGLCKPVPGHYICANNEAKMLMVASAAWQFKIYTQTLGLGGMRLEPVLSYQQPLSSVSICHQLVSGGKEHFFYSLRATSEEGGRKMQVHRISKKTELFEQQAIPLEDPSAHMLIPRGGDSFIAIGKENLIYFINGKKQLIKLPQVHEYIQSCYFRRVRQKKQDLFIVNEHGQLSHVVVDENKPNGCIVVPVEKLFPMNQVVVLQRNLFFSVSANQDNYLFNLVYRPDERFRSSRAREEDTLNTKHSHIKELDILGSMAGPRMIRDMRILNMEKGTSSQIVIAGGSPGNKKGFLSVLKYGLKVREYLNISFVNPVGAWCLKKSLADKHHSYIVFTFGNRKTSCYHFENNMLLHSNQLKLQQSETTLHVNKLCDGSIVQVTGSKIRHIQRENYYRDTSIKGRIMKATCVAEGRQLLILLIGGFMEYYELNNNSELKLINEFNLDSEASFIDFAPPDHIDNKPFSRLVVIGKTNYNISIFTVQSKGLQLKRSKNIKCLMQSLTIVSYENNYRIVVGTNAGKMVRLLINNKGEELSEVQQMVIGEKAVKFAKITINNKLNLIRICPQPTLSYLWQGQQQLCALPLPNIDFFTQISVEGLQKHCMFLTYYDNYLRFVQISGFGNLLQQFDKEIDFTGRKIVICRDRLGVLSQSKEKKTDKQVWKSVFCLFNPNKNYFLQKYLEFDENQKCISLCYVPRQESKGFLCLGCVSDYQTYPTLRAQKPCIKVYTYQKEKNTILNMLYRFAIDDIPTAMEVYLDKLLVGVGKKLILYDIFSSKLLLKALRPNLNSYLNSIAVEGQKIITSEVFNSFSVYRLNMAQKSFDYIGEDILPRFISASQILDGNYGVIAGGDKFGNFFVSKFSQKIKSEFESGGQTKYNQFTDCNKLESIASCNIGEVVTSIQTGRLDQRKPSSIFYSTIDGRIGMFYPFDSDELKEHTLLTKLQKQLRSSNTLPSATNHEGFRSFYSPAKGVIDGDFCRMFENLGESEKQRIANALQMDSKEINLLLTSMQNKFK